MDAWTYGSMAAWCTMSRRAAIESACPPRCHTSPPRYRLKRRATSQVLSLANSALGGGGAGAWGVQHHDRCGARTVRLSTVRQGGGGGHCGERRVSPGCDWHPRRARAAGQRVCRVHLHHAGNTHLLHWATLKRCERSMHLTLLPHTAGAVRGGRGGHLGVAVHPPLARALLHQRHRTGSLRQPHRSRRRWVCVALPLMRTRDPAQPVQSGVASTHLVSRRPSRVFRRGSGGGHPAAATAHSGGAVYVVPHVVCASSSAQCRVQCRTGRGDGPVWRQRCRLLRVHPAGAPPFAL
jgi:hypothetical protein